MFNKYYQDELTYLRELGREYSEARPEAARFLGEAGSDPDVERLLEGFAFLTGRVRQKLDDEMPELTRSMMELFFPQFLRAIPPMAIVQISHKQGADAKGERVPRGSYLDSVELDGNRCRFRTTTDLVPVPAVIQRVDFSEAAPPSLKVTLQLLSGYAWNSIGGDRLRFFLAGDAATTRALYLCLCQRTAAVRVGGVHCPAARVVPANLDVGAGMLPAPSGAFEGFRLLQEYFAFPSRFMFVDVEGLPLAKEGATVEIEFEFSSLPEDMPPLAVQNLMLNCVPVVNLFDHDADPVRVEADRSQYKIRPSGHDQETYEVYSVTRLSGSVRGSAEGVEFAPLFSFQRAPSSAGHFFDVRPMDSTQYEGEDHFAIIGGGSGEDLVTLSIDTVCTNRRQGERLGVGDIHRPAGKTPLVFEYRNVTRPTATVAAPSGDDIYWRLLANMSLNYMSLADLETLRSLLRLYDFRSRDDRTSRRQLENRVAAILEVRSQRVTTMFEGAPVRGVEVVLRVDEEKFGGEGEVFLFGTVFSEFLAQYVTINSFSRLRVDIVKSGDTLEWPARLGAGVLL